MAGQICVYPVPPLDKHPRGNPYLNMVNRELGILGVSVVFDRLSLDTGPDTLQPGAVVHFHWPSEIYASRDREDAKRRLKLWPGFLAEVGKRCPIVWTVHNLFPHDSRFPDLDWDARRILIAHCKHLTVHCNRARDLLEAEFGPLPPVSVLPHPNYSAEYPEPPDRQSARRALRMSPDTFLFLMFGRIRDYKGIESALAAFRDIELPHARLHVAGWSAGLDLAPVQRHAYEDPRITLHDERVPVELVAKLFAAADISLHCYKDILTSGSIPLAQSMGTAVIAPRVGCLEEMVPESCGILYDPQDSAGLKAAMLEAMVADVAQMGREGRNFIANRTVQNFARELLALYRSLAP
jgi:glycosyltransferase involved in cell wall biosynthesis